MNVRKLVRKYTLSTKTGTTKLVSYSEIAKNPGEYDITESYLNQIKYLHDNGLDVIYVNK